MSNLLKELINSDQLETVLAELSEIELYELSKAATSAFRNRRQLKRDAHWRRSRLDQQVIVGYAPCIREDDGFDVERQRLNGERLRQNDDDVRYRDNCRENYQRDVSRHEFDALATIVSKLSGELRALKARTLTQEPDVEDERY